jgi:hypothetical protein
MVELLKKYISIDYPVAIYTNRNEYDRFAVGNIIAVTAEYTLVKNINPRGEFDGYCVIRTDDIYRLETSSEYLIKIEKLYVYKKNDTTFDICIEGNLLTNLLQYAHDNNIISKICINEDSSDIIGYVNEFLNDKVKKYK